MDPKVLYWTGALANMIILVAIGISGVRQIRRGEVARHRRSMLTSASLVLVFIGSYVLKLIFLGREDLASWEPTYVRTLRFHELCVLLMVVGGGLALTWGRALRQSNAIFDESDSATRLRKRHRMAGRTALVAALVGVASAALVLTGMYGRS
ncbi:MAG: DUF420 domain-containing protein [Deltaproteobacteria bacterium]|nr:DUF420 domain-containing protein [Deltaproteobacteria bacterium]MBW2383097.1 DUF420 domain-containing protein [Deltaproteobacteria bacterium]MBW2696073.1 DUF420 domain-containing protein [Deltaproteobacteria bacterium]